MSPRSLVPSRNAPEAASGLLLLDKPSGPTSFDCIRQVRRILQQKRVGHCGTLDPMAEGVLVLLFGQHTRRQDDFLEMEKQYWFRSELGKQTDSGDRTGVVTRTRPVGEITLADLQRIADSFNGEQWQTPPRVSALKYKGKRLYEWARQGVDVPRAPRKIYITDFTILAYEKPLWEARVVCSRGTYIRALVEDVAWRLGTVATVDALIRERVGRYRREDALGWNELCRCTREDLLRFSHG